MVRIEETKRHHYDWSTSIAKLAMTEIATAKKDGRAFVTVDGNLKALRRAMAILESARIERYAILDAAKEVDRDSLPALVFRQLTTKEVEELRQPPAED